MRYDAMSFLFSAANGDALKCAANSAAMRGIGEGLVSWWGRSMRAKGSVTATRKSAVVCRVAGSYPISMKYCLALSAGPKYAM